MSNQPDKNPYDPPIQAQQPLKQPAVGNGPSAIAVLLIVFLSAVAAAVAFFTTCFGLVFGLPDIVPSNGSILMVFVGSIVAAVLAAVCVAWIGINISRSSRRS